MTWELSSRAKSRKLTNHQERRLAFAQPSFAREITRLRCAPLEMTGAMLGLSR